MITTVENYGIRVRKINKAYTSLYYPFCGTKGARIKRDLLFCSSFSQKMNVDTAGVLNIVKINGEIIQSPS